MSEHELEDEEYEYARRLIKHMDEEQEDQITQNELNWFGIEKELNWFGNEKHKLPKIKYEDSITIQKLPRVYPIYRDFSNEDVQG